MATCFCSVSAQSQTKYLRIYEPNYFVQLPTTDNKQFYKDNGIAYLEYRTFRIKKNGKEIKHKHQNTFTIDSDGNVIKINNTKNSKPSHITSYVYDENGKITSMIIVDNENNFVEEKHQRMNENGVMVEYVELSENQDTLEHLLKYVPTGGNTKSDYYYKKGKLKQRWVSEYDDAGTKLKTTLYKPNGKVKYIWDYRCNEEGVELNKHKDTTTICKTKTQDEDGITTLVYQYSNEKGEIYKNISRYNKAEKLIYLKSVKGVEETMLREFDYEYAGDDSTLLSAISKYYHKGELRNIYTTQYDKYGLQTSKDITRFKNGLIDSQSVETYEYNEADLPLLRKIINTKTGVGQKSTYKYVKDENITN